MVHVIQLCVAGSVCFNVAHITLVARGRFGSGMRLVGGIEMRACRTGISRAAIAEFMHVESVLSGRKSADFRADLHAIGDRRECDGAAHFIASGRMQHRDTF